MLVTKNELARYKERTEYALTSLQDRYWILSERYELLLKHFGLTEHTTPETKELRTNGGPEREA